MRDNWHMNRIGFVNFWLFDEEIFQLADGKLLLRGENGSGKSITTQSIIPFILDGDRTPSRLDSFGTMDRKMEYYFLRDGESETDDVTGYIYLEFKKGGTEQYRTIGIGQRAQKGKPLGFWDFVILDGRRPGYDGFNLYEEIGSKKIPYSRQDLKKLLGDENFFTESQKDYRDAVNKHFFGFARIEQYAQFVNLLIKVRAPKLSKEFKPSKVYEILNDSLQTLSDDDMRAMVDAMKNMDSIEAQLNGLKKADAELKVLQNVYARYNRFMLSHKAQIYLEHKAEAEKSTEIFSKVCRERESNILERARLLKEREALKEEAQELRAEQDALNPGELAEHVKKQSEYQESLRECENRMAALNLSIEKNREKVLQFDAEKRTENGNLDLTEQKVCDCSDTMDELNEEVCFPGHGRLKELTDGDRKAAGEFETGVRELRDKIEKGREAISSFEKADRDWDASAERLSEAQAGLADAQKSREEAVDAEYRCRDMVTEFFYRTDAANQELKFGNERLDLLTSAVRQYHGAESAETIFGILRALREEKEKPIREALQKTETRLKEATEKQALLARELKQLEELEQAEPSRRDKVAAARKILRDKGIPFLPFYEAVEFGKDLKPEEQDLLESQVTDAGLLDALVVPDDFYEKAENALADLSDTLIRQDLNSSGFAGAADAVGTAGVAGVSGNVGYFEGLIPGNIEPAFRIAVERILSGFGTSKDGNRSTVFLKNGFFRNGVLEGFSKPDGEASYIGTEARKRKREKLIAEKKRETEAADIEISELKKEKEGLLLRKRVLSEEYSVRPDLNELNGSIEKVRLAENEVMAGKKDLSRYEEEEKSLKGIRAACEQKVLECCRTLPYERTAQTYSELLNAVRSYDDAFQDLKTELMNLQRGREKLDTIEERIQDTEALTDQIYADLKKEKAAASELTIRLDAVRSYLANPENREKAKRLVEIAALLKSGEEKLENDGQRLAVLENAVARASEEMEKLKNSADTQAAATEKLRSYFMEEYRLSLVFRNTEKAVKSTAENAESDEGGKAEKFAAEEARDCQPENERKRTLSDVQGALLEVLQTKCGTLTRYGIRWEDCFEDDPGDVNILRKRYRILATLNGQKLYLSDFQKAIRASIDSTGELIQQKDRELFENILSDTLSGKLSRRIAESREWIREMSGLMKEMDTSMGLSFSLTWKPKEAESGDELGTEELERIFGRDSELLTQEDISKVAKHFRTRIHILKENAEETHIDLDYLDMIRDVLDYRKWFEFRMFYYRGTVRKEMTNSAFNRFSGGEKAMAMYVPLFAAVNAQYRKAEDRNAPRIIALDEAFAGVDDKNISSMFKLVGTLDFDYIMNSQALWGCYQTVPSLRIAEMIKPENSDVVSVIDYYWNGREKVLDE